MKIMLKNKKKQTNEEGVALVIVMGAITIMTALLADFVFDINVNKLKAYNQQEMIQARLNAESGLRMAYLRLEYYEEALNYLEKQKDLKKMVKADMLNDLWSTPFMYPIPGAKDMDLLQKNALNEFEKNSLILGDMSVTIQNVSQLINLNLLRVPKAITPTQSQTQQAPDPDEENQAPDIAIQERLVELLEQKFEKEREKNEKEFDEIYPNHDSELIVESIKYFITENEEKASFNRKSEVEGLYTEAGVKPKKAAFSSLTELYLVPGLNDAVIDLIKDHLTVHGLKTIDVNTITDTTLKWLFPELTEDQKKAFFKYRDNPEHPHYFESFEDFSNYIINKAHIADKTSFDKRIEEFTKAGVSFGPTASLFKVISIGKKNRTSYSLTAYVLIPTYEPPPPPITKPVNERGECEENYTLNPDGMTCTFQKNLVKKDPNAAQTKVVQYLKPRIVEISIN